MLHSKLALTHLPQMCLFQRRGQQVSGLKFPTPSSLQLSLNDRAGGELHTRISLDSFSSFSKHLNKKLAQLLAHCFSEQADQPLSSRAPNKDTCCYLITTGS